MRGAHRAFFLDDDEKARAIELLRRVEEFSGVIVLAYAIMSNHFHILIYVPEPEDIGDEEILRRINALYREVMREILAAREAERAEREAKGEPALSRRTDPDHPLSPQQRYRLAGVTLSTLLY